MVWQPLGACIGWLHGDRLYLDPEAAFSVVQRLAESQQAPLPLPSRPSGNACMSRACCAVKLASKRIKCGGPLAANASMLSIYPLSISKKPVLPVLPVHAAQEQQNQHVPLDLFPAWYQQKPVHTTRPQPPPSWTGFDASPGPVLQTEWVHANGLQVQQHQGGGPEGPLGPEMDSRGDAGNALTPAACPRCGADQVTLVQRQGQPACVGCSL